MNLNEFQRRAVEYTDGPVLVLAGPGSGKTATIIERIKYLVTHQKSQPGKILVVTFTKLAATEMKNRYCDLMKANEKTPVFSTIHALCYEVVRRKKGVSRLNIAKESDLDSIIAETKKILLEEPQYLKQWQAMYDYIMVDEFQDTSSLQMEIFALLAGERENIMVVGDDDQAIYGFRGGNPEVFMLFLEYYPHAAKIQLKVNYRSKEEIVRLAERLIAHNTTRMRKDATICAKGTSNLRSEYGNRETPVAFNVFENQLEQMESIIKEIHSWQENVPLGKMAVLFRTKMQFRLFLICAKLHGLPVHCKESKNGETYFFVEEICSYLRVITGFGKREDYIRIINVPNREIDRNLLNTSDVDEQIWINSARKAGTHQENQVKSFLSQIQTLKKMPPYLALCHLYYQISYKQDLMHRLEKEDMMIEKDIAEGILRLILHQAKSVKSHLELCEWLEEERFCEKGGVEVLTMHASKGLEFDVVFLPDLNEDVLPNKKAVQSSNVEEERRLLYVAITRAKESVYLSYVTKKNNTDVKASVFVNELII